MDDRVTQDQGTSGSGMIGPRARSGTTGPLRAHAAFVTVFILSAALTALALTYIYSERYEAKTTIFFKPANVMKLNEAQVQALGSPVPNTPFKVISQTLTGLARSDSVLRQVVLDLSLQVPEPKTKSPLWYVQAYRDLKDYVEEYAADAWSYLKFGRIVTLDPVDAAILDVVKGLKISNEDSYVFTLSVRAKKPQTAAAIANAIAARLADLLRQSDRDGVDLQQAHLRKLIAENSDQLDRVESNIRDLLDANHIASVQADIERSTYRHSQLAVSSAEGKADLSQQQARLAAIAEKLRQLSPVPLSTPSGDDQVLRRQSDRLGADQYASLSAERVATEVSLGGLRARNASFDQSLREIDQRFKMLTDAQAKFDLLSQELTTAKRNYVALHDTLAEETIKRSDGQSELRVTSTAFQQGAPVSPIKVYHVGLATLVAAMVACGLAYVLSYFNIRLFLPRQGGSRPTRERAGGATAAVAVS